MHPQGDTGWRNSLSQSDLVQSYTFDGSSTYIKLAKAGYYQIGNGAYGGQQTINHFNVGDSVPFTGGYSLSCYIYLGETNPFE